MNSQSIIDFWFFELKPNQWFVKDEEVDDLIRQRYSDLHLQAVQNELSHWRASPLGRLAEIIVLDQFSRNMYRNSAKAFAADPIAIRRVYEALEEKVDNQLETEQRAFLYMPLMHSENLRDHDNAMILFNQPGLERNLEFERRHRNIIERFGRYPHRNEVLGRKSTQEEIEFLKQPGSSF